MTTPSRVFWFNSMRASGGPPPSTTDLLTSAIERDFDAAAGSASGPSRNNNNNNTIDDNGEVIFPSIHNAYLNDPVTQFLNNIDPIIPRDVAQEWADERLGGVLNLVESRERDNRMMDQNEEHLFYQHVIAYVKDRNSDLERQIIQRQGALGNFPVQSHPQGGINVVVPATQAAGVGASTAAAAAVATASPGDILFGSANAVTNAQVHYSAMQAVDSTYMRGKFVINPEMKTMCDVAISHLLRKKPAKFQSCTYKMFLGDKAVRDQFADLVGEVYLLRKIESPAGTKYVHENAARMKDAKIVRLAGHLAFELKRVGNSFVFMKETEVKGCVQSEINKFSSLLD